MQGVRRVNPKQQRAQEAQGDPIGDLRERMAKVETIVKYGFPLLAAYITALKFVPNSQPVNLPAEAAAALINFLT